MIEILNEDKRQAERRADWHTPADCFRLLDVQKAMDQVNDRLDKGQERMDSIEAMLAQNTSVTTEIKDILDTAKGFFKVTGKIGTFIKWALGIATAVLAFWFTLKSGKQ